MESWGGLTSSRAHTALSWIVPAVAGLALGAMIGGFYVVKGAPCGRELRRSPG